MSTVRGTLWLTYLMVALVIFASASSIWERAHDPMWAQMSESRLNYDVISVGVAILSAVVAYGVWKKREWGRIFGISLAIIVLFMFVGIRLLAPVLSSGDVSISLGWEAAFMGSLSIACIITLWRQSFRGN